MCRNIKTLFNFDPPATEEEIREASLQFVRKLSGFYKSSRANEPVFNRAVEEVAAVARNLLDSLVTNAEPRASEIEASSSLPSLRSRAVMPSRSASDTLALDNSPIERVLRRPASASSSAMPIFT